MWPEYQDRPPTSITPHARARLVPGGARPASGSGGRRARQWDGGEARSRRPIPDTPGSYQFKDAQGRVLYVGKAKSLRSRLMSATSAPETLARAHPPDGGRGRHRRVDRGPQRGRGAVPRVQPHQEAPAALQHPVQGRQVVPVPRGHARRGVAAGDGAAGRQAQGRPLLRAVRPRLRDPRDARPPAAHVPDPHLHQGQVRPPPAARPPVPLRAHREVRGALRRLRSTREDYDAPRRRADPVPRRRHRAGARPARQADARGERRARVRARGAAARPDRLGAQGDRAPADGRRRRKRTSTSSGSPTTRSRRRCRCSSCARAASSAARAWSSTRSRTSTRRELVGRLLEQLYGGARPRRHPARGARARRARRRRALRGVPRTARGGSACGVRVPQRGAKRELLATVDAERAGGVRAPQAAASRRTTTPGRARCSRCRTRSDLPEAPLRIECFDISNLQGTEIVASMVVMEDGLPKRSDYRRFKIRHQEGQDDFAAMEEALTRRFRRYLDERDEGARAGKRFAYPPNLLLVDGGKGQLDVAVRVLEELGLEDICVASLAKRFEEVYLPGATGAGPHPARLRGAVPAPAGARRGAPVRDHVPPPAARQAHDAGRCSTTCPGLGPVRRRRLLKEFGSVKRLRELTEDGARRRSPGSPRRSPRGARTTLHAPRGRATRDHEISDVTVITGMSGRGPLGGRRRARGPRLLRDRQPAARAHHEGRRARRAARSRRPAVRAGRRRPRRRVHRRARTPRSPSCASAARTPGSCSSTPPTTCSCAATRPPDASTRSRRASACPRASSPSVRCSRT